MKFAARSFAATLAVLAPLFAQAQDGMVWSIRIGGHTSYLAGITHISLRTDYDTGLPSALRAAVGASKAVYLEGNVLQFTDAGQLDVQQWIAELPARYPKVDLAPLRAVSSDIDAVGRALLDQVRSGRAQNPALPPRVLERLSQAVTAVLPASGDGRNAAATVNALAAASEPWLVFEVPTLLSARARGRTASRQPHLRLAPGLDSLVLDAARRAGLKVERLESYPETMRAIATAMGDAKEAQLLSLIDESLDPEVDSLVPMMTHAVYTGDVLQVSRAIELQSAASTVFRKVLMPSADARNRSWLTRIETLMTSQACPCVFAVGGAHLVGDSGLPALLASRGAVVTRLQAAKP